MTEPRAKPEVNKRELVCDLKKVREALQADHSLGECLPTATYTRLHYSALDALGFLAKRKMGRYSK